MFSCASDCYLDAKSLAAAHFIHSLSKSTAHKPTASNDCLLVEFNRVHSSSSALRMCRCYAKSVPGGELLLVGGLVVWCAGLELHSGWFV